MTWHEMEINAERMRKLRAERDDWQRKWETMCIAFTVAAFCAVLGWCIIGTHWLEGR